MLPATSGHPVDAVDAVGVTGPHVPPPHVPPPLTPPDREVRQDAPPDTGGDALTRARVRESADRNQRAAHAFEAGRHDEALTLFEQALRSCRAVLGNDHPETLTVAGNLAVTHVAVGNGRKGIKLLTANLDARVRVFGDTHPATLTARNALAVAYRVTGDADAAVPLAKQVVVQRSQTLGAAHPDTLTSRMGLAIALAGTGAARSAHRILAATITDAENTLGPGHRHTTALVECGEAAGLLRREV
jgi:hypothetical protein